MNIKAEDYVSFGITLLQNSEDNTRKMKTFIAISCLLALAAAVPAPQYTSKYKKPYQKEVGGMYTYINIIE